MKFLVTEDCIKKGERKPYQDPIALALEKVIKKPVFLWGLADEIIKNSPLTYIAASIGGTKGPLYCIPEAGPWLTLFFSGAFTVPRKFNINLEMKNDT
jgi:hypothetical protein